MQFAAASGAVALLPRFGFASEPSSFLYNDGSDEIPAPATGDPEKVIIIGAGIAGLAAANALTQAGVNCEVLEARHRIGGRIHTVDIGGYPIDLGASWIHQPEGNPLSRLTKQLGVRQLPADLLEVDSTSFFDARKANRLVPLSETSPALEHAAEFIEKYESGEGAAGKHESLKQAAESFMSGKKLTGDVRLYTAFFIKQFYSGECQDWSETPMSLVGAADRRLPKPNHEPYTGAGEGHFPEGGYKRLIQPLAKGLQINYGHEVTKITYDSKGVTVKCNVDDGSSTKVVKGTHVIITVPLGLLKAGRVEFDPPLPESNLGAIKRIGYGNFEKSALIFPKPFWTEMGRTHMSHLAADDSFSFPLTIDLQLIAGIPGLLAINSGPFAKNFTVASSKQLRENHMSILRKVYGDGIPDPIDSATSSWVEDPYTLGSLSNNTMETRATDRFDLAQPVGGRVLFAGEATDLVDRPSSVDGAFSTGIREAKRLLQRANVEIRL